jgi:hypothetical protein
MRLRCERRTHCLSKCLVQSFALVVLRISAPGVPAVRITVTSFETYWKALSDMIVVDGDEHPDEALPKTEG